jgi:hypothetical protein
MIAYWRIAWDRRGEDEDETIRPNSLLNLSTGSSYPGSLPDTFYRRNGTDIAIHNGARPVAERNIAWPLLVGSSGLMGNDPVGDAAHVVSLLSARKAQLPFLYFGIDGGNGFPAFGLIALIIVISSFSFTSSRSEFLKSCFTFAFPSATSTAAPTSPFIAWFASQCSRLSCSALQPAA